MAQSHPQELISFALKQGGKFTTKEAVELLGRYYYCNGAHYVSEMISRMVKNGTVEKVSRGSYVLKSFAGVKKSAEIINPNQSSLF